MFETLVIIAIVLAVIIAAVLIIAATKPDRFSVLLSSMHRLTRSFP